MSALLAARMSDAVGAHTSAMAGISWGAIAGLAVGVAAAAFTIATFGTGALVIAAAVATVGATGIGGALMGESIGATYESGDPCSSITSGSPNVVVEGKKAARAGLDKVGHNSKLVAVGSSKVIVNNAPFSRLTDAVQCAGKIIKACRKTFVGGPPVSAVSADSMDHDGFSPTTRNVLMGAALVLGAVALAPLGIGAVIVGTAVGLVVGTLGSEAGAAAGAWTARNWGWFSGNEARGAAYGSAVGGLVAGGVSGAKSVKWGQAAEVRVLGAGANGLPKTALPMKGQGAPEAAPAATQEQPKLNIVSEQRDLIPGITGPEQRYNVLRVKDAPKGQGEISYQRIDTPDGPEYAIMHVDGIKRGEGPAGTGQAVTKHFLDNVAKDSPVRAVLDETNAARLDGVLKDNPRPSVQDLAQDVPFFRQKGYDYTLDPVSERGKLSVKMQRNGTDESRITNPNVYEHPNFKKLVRYAGGDPDAPPPAATQRTTASGEPIMQRTPEGGYAVPDGLPAKPNRQGNLEAVMPDGQTIGEFRQMPNGEYLFVQRKPSTQVGKGEADNAASYLRAEHELNQSVAQAQRHRNADHASMELKSSVGQNTGAATHGLGLDVHIPDLSLAAGLGAVALMKAGSRMVQRSKGRKAAAAKAAEADAPAAAKPAPVQDSGPPCATCSGAGPGGPAPAPPAPKAPPRATVDPALLGPGRPGMGRLGRSYHSRSDFENGGVRPTTPAAPAKPAKPAPTPRHPNDPPRTYVVEKNGQKYTIIDETVTDSWGHKHSQLRVEGAPKGEGNLQYSIHRNEDGSVAMVGLDGVYGVKGQKGAGGAMKEVLLDNIAGDAPVTSFMNDVNETSFHNVVRENPVPTIQDLQKGVPAFKHDGYDFKIDVNDGLAGVTMTRNGTGQSKIANPEVFQTDKYKKFLSDNYLADDPGAAVAAGNARNAAVEAAARAAAPEAPAPVPAVGDGPSPSPRTSGAVGAATPDGPTPGGASGLAAAASPDAPVGAGTGAGAATAAASPVDSATLASTLKTRGGNCLTEALYSIEQMREMGMDPTFMKHPEASLHHFATLPDGRIVDPTYQFFFKGFSREDSPVFVGTKEELIKVFDHELATKGLDKSVDFLPVKTGEDLFNIVHGRALPHTGPRNGGPGEYIKPATTPELPTKPDLPPANVQKIEGYPPAANDGAPPPEPPPGWNDPLMAHWPVVKARYGNTKEVTAKDAGAPPKGASNSAHGAGGDACTTCGSASAAGGGGGGATVIPLNAAASVKSGPAARSGPWSSRAADAIAQPREVAKTAPIRIPADAKVTVQHKAAGYDQIRYQWSTPEAKYEARWHTETPNAPAGTGEGWVVTKTVAGNMSGQRKSTSVMTGEDEWTPHYVWQDAVAANKAGRATPEQDALLESGHWRDGRGAVGEEPAAPPPPVPMASPTQDVEAPPVDASPPPAAFPVAPTPPARAQVPPPMVSPAAPPTPNGAPALPRPNSGSGGATDTQGPRTPPFFTPYLGTSRLPQEDEEGRE